MSDAGDAVRRHRALLSQQTEEYEQWLATVTQLRLPWREGHEKLYKFKSLRGGSKKHVVDIFTNSRIYLSTPDEFNDPLDCAPVFKLARDPPDQALIDELQEHERVEFAAAGKSPKQIARLRKSKGVDIRRFAAAVTEDVRNKLQAATFVYCLSADQEHPLFMVSLCGQS
jgi:hypothetical protein